jgi:signal recognition particle subunit SRP19
MKEYKRRVLWIDYFNSTTSRGEGRRIRLDKSVKDPTLEELSEAARRLGYTPEVVSAKFPTRMNIPSGYLSIEKKSNLTKSQVISDFAKTLSAIRGEKSSSAAEKDQKPSQAKRH